MTEFKTLVLVDGSALAFRSFYALFTSGMRKSDGTPTWAVFGFFKALFDLLEKCRPEMIAVCFDLAEPTFRHVEYAEYKANRAEMPDELSQQWPIIKKGVETLGIPVYELAGYEADDVIGTIAKQATSKGMHVLILTGDQDAFQLLDDNIQVLMPSRDGVITFGRQEVFNKLGVWPEQVRDYKGLCGDASDNIPGVKGIGPKTAAPLLNQFHSIEGVYEHIDEVKGAVKQKLVEGKASAFASRDLATIRLDVPIEFDFAHCHLTLPDIEELVSLLRDLEFKSILKRLPQALAPFNQGVPPQISQIPALMPGCIEKFGGVSAERDEVQPTEVGVYQLSCLPDRTLGSPQPRIIRTATDLHELIDELSRQTVLCVDLETTGLNSLNTEIVGYAFAWSNGASLRLDGSLETKQDNWHVKTAYVPVRHIGEECLEPNEAKLLLKQLLEDGNIGKIAQNAKFEMNVLSLLGIRFGPLVFDPMLASYIVNPDDSHGLKDQSERILGHQMVRIAELIGSGRKQLTMDMLSVSKVAPYAADDARIALELARHYNHNLDLEQRFLLWQMELPLTAVLSKMEQAGVALDLLYLNDFSRELTTDLKAIEQDIYGLAGHAFNVSSTQQLQKVLFEELKLPAKVRTKSGYSTDAAVLKDLANLHPIVARVLEYRELSKLRSTYADALPRQISSRDGRLHGEFNQTGTSTGRLSSSNPNLQNIPIRSELGKRIRRAFVPGRDGTMLVSADYSQIELRLLAHMSGDETLIDAFTKDQDIHARTAMEIFDVPLDKVTSEMRRVGKTINFSLIYQQGAYSTAQDLGVSTREAQKFIDKYFSRYPKVRTFINATIEEARRNGFVKTLWGRKRYFRALADRNEQLRRAEERAACNAPLQGSAADLMKLAMVELDRQLCQRQLSSKLILQVHDELVLEVPHAELVETTQLVTEAMTLHQPFMVPLRVDVGVGKTWMDLDK
ncbi:MAG: DNA polymerase I [Candidatus Melainabacteria bacterium]|nr:DNA polymerase I [Candidatus Melainabacteria bacterium]